MSREAMSREAMKQPEALWLADVLDHEFTQGRISNYNGRKAAIELRRLHEVNQDLLKALHEALETEQEPVAWISERDNLLSWDKFYDHMKPLYTAPPKREWVGLTAYEIQEIHSGNQHWGNFACAIEAKLKEKNHG